MDRLARKIGRGLVAGLIGTAVAPPATEWGVTEVAVDAWHHSVYIAATAAAFEWLRR